jgi:hypothetical protein
MYIFIIIVVIILIVIIIFYTPQVISDIIYGINFGNLKFIYYDKNKKRLLSYNFNHKDYDGSLMSYSIQNNLVKYNIENDIKIYKLKKYQYLNNERILDFSLFTSSISHLLNEIMMYQNRKIKICIIVSIRHNLIDKTQKGNFIKLAYYTISPKNNKIDICNIHNYSVKNIKFKNYLIKNTTLYDFIKSFINIDYVFNSRRDLSTINTLNGLLIKQSTNKITHTEIYNLKHVPNRLFIVLDFFNKHYIISHIIPF